MSPPTSIPSPIYYFDKEGDEMDESEDDMDDEEFDSEEEDDDDNGGGNRDDTDDVTVMDAGVYEEAVLTRRFATVRERRGTVFSRERGRRGYDDDDDDVSSDTDESDEEEDEDDGENGVSIPHRRKFARAWQQIGDGSGAGWDRPIEAGPWDVDGQEEPSATAEESTQVSGAQGWEMQSQVALFAIEDEEEEEEEWSDDEVRTKALFSDSQ